MAIAHYLAMTAEEMAAAPLPPHPAWMACHFSAYSTGLSNLPDALPEQSLLILNDRVPIHGHDAERICKELRGILDRFHCTKLLVDFQNPVTQEAEELIRQLISALPCKIAVTANYQQEGAAIFLPPVPATVPLREHIAPWNGSEIWLETSLEGQNIRLTQKGAAITPLIHTETGNTHKDTGLHCRYTIQEEEENAVCFHCWRTQEELTSLLAEAETLGITTAVGLYQEIGILH